MKSVREDAKSDWLRLVKKHKRKQKGLHALSTLNPNAGNVEKSIELFNDMQPQGSITVDAANGNVSSEASVCEALNKDTSIVLSYENIPIEVPERNSKSYGYYSSRMHFRQCTSRCQEFRQMLGYGNFGKHRRQWMLHFLEFRWKSGFDCL